MFCRKCGKELPEGAKFCNHCGTPCDEGVRQGPQPVCKVPSPPEKRALVRHLVTNADVIKTSSKSKALIPVIVAAGILLVAVIWLFVSNAKKPSHVSESGDYTLQINDTFQFKSTKSSICFEEISFDEPQYDSTNNALTAPVTFSLRVDIPGKKYKEEYADWLNDFSVNGTQATSSVRTYRPETDDCYLLYSVHYDSVPSDESYMLTCKVNNRLSLHFFYGQSFWDNVDYGKAIAVGQATLDDEYGITYVDWQNGANSLNYVEDKVYCMTGKVQSCGEYMWGITDQYYVILTAKGALVDTHCYFSRDEWNRSPDVKAGDIVTFYGSFDFESFGWNFDNCTFTSPAGTFTIDGNSTSVSQIAFPTEDFSSDDDTAHQYGEDEMLVSIPIDRSWPFGYYERNDGGASLSLEYYSDDDSIGLDLYESLQGFYYGGEWLEPDFTAYFDWFDISANYWNLTINGTDVGIFVTDSYITIDAKGPLGGLSADKINGTYYLKQQAIQP